MGLLRWNTVTLLPQWRPCSVRRRHGLGLCGGRDSMWAKHDVFRPSLHTCHHLQSQHLPGFLILTHLLPPWGEFTTVICIWIDGCTVLIMWITVWTSPNRLAVMRWSVSAIRITLGKTAACLTRSPFLLHQRALKNTKVNAQKKMNREERKKKINLWEMEEM